MQRRSTLRAVPIVLTVVALAALARGERTEWPDDVHVRHGLPWTWGTHTLVTIVGAVDTWRIDFVNLGLDLALWGAVVAASFWMFWRPDSGRCPAGDRSTGVDR